MAVTLPPQSPSPLRPVMSIASSVPSCGQVASTVVTAIDAVQVWLGLQAFGTQIESPASGTAGNAPGAVSPPVEAEYWVAATAPPGNSMTWPTPSGMVSVTARSDVALSLRVPR